MSYFVDLLASFLAVMVVVCLHEYAHAYAADKWGDPTPRLRGRLTLNPIAHFDPLGIIMFAIAGFGWANPVPINPYNFRDYKKGSFWTSCAGILTNYVTAFLFYPIFSLAWEFLIPLLAGKYASGFVFEFLRCLVVYSLSFCVFNLLPLYPLDGFRILDALNKKRGKVFQFLREYGHRILIVLILISALADRITIFQYIDVLGFILNISVSIFGKPITSFWNWLLGVFGIAVPWVL